MGRIVTTCLLLFDQELRSSFDQWKLACPWILLSRVCLQSTRRGRILPEVVQWWQVPRLYLKDVNQPGHLDLEPPKLVPF